MADDSRSLEEKRDWALAGNARWEARLTQADALQDRAREMGGGIPGFGGSGNQRAARQVRSAFSSADRAWSEASEKLEYFTSKARGYQRRIDERDRVRLAQDDIVGAQFIRTSSGWRKVRTVNKVTVSVDSGYSWADKIPFEQVLEVRK